MCRGYAEEQGIVFHEVPGLAPNSLPHIFRQAPGHVHPSTVASRRRFQNVFQQVAAHSGNLNTSGLAPSAMQNGVQQYTQNFRNGQVWVQTNSIGQMINAGVNRVGSFR